ncbi:hypothetical protein [Paenibacillus lutrae]|uniref:Uncharacterized protein n=1 Tax=Paenibacillus lutrae TaxID=2078573 RepID=A0A7X3FLZ7_9BACL|nr:hypothetical protein [Paenibacillus lutrae]MVP02100.1 hypothetical protein [Paenibacillus lutrae]
MKNNGKLMLIIALILAIILYTKFIDRSSDPATLQKLPNIAKIEVPTGGDVVSENRHDGEGMKDMREKDIFHTFAVSLYKKDYANAFSLFDLESISDYLSSPDYYGRVKAWGESIQAIGVLQSIDIVSSSTNRNEHVLRFSFSNGIRRNVTFQLGETKYIVTKPDEILNQLVK